MGDGWVKELLESCVHDIVHKEPHRARDVASNKGAHVDLMAE